MNNFSADRMFSFFLIITTVIPTVAVVNYAWAMNVRDTGIRNPTYQEVMSFIAVDQTDKNTFIMGNYTCLNFAVDVRNHALMKGIRCGLVYVVFSSSSHAIVCFDTTDQGLIYIEPQNDAVVKPNIGQPYWNRTEYRPPLYDDKVIYIAIVWNTNTVFTYN